MAGTGDAVSLPSMNNLPDIKARGAVAPEQNLVSLRAFCQPRQSAQASIDNEITRPGACATRGIGSACRAALLLTLTVIMLAIPITTASAATKTVSGDLQCSGAGWVQKIWFLGSQSGWHGVNVPADRQPTTMYDRSGERLARYSFTAVKGELVKVWITCSSSAEHYSEFTVGSGGKRHICDWGGGMQWCGPQSWGKCATDFAIGNKLKSVFCFARNT